MSHKGLDFDQLLSGIPSGLRDELISEYNNILNNFYEGRWKPSELHAGRFCEVVYSILKGRADRSYPKIAAKPPQFDQACKKLENSTALERGLRILVARALPPLYEIRNNRGVGHVGGDVDSNYLDANYSVSSTGWIIGELIRVYHNLSPDLAARAVNQLVELKTPAVWVSGDVRRVLDTTLSIKDQCLILIASSSQAMLTDLAAWTEVSSLTYLRKVIRALHKERLIEASDLLKPISLMPPGAKAVRKLLAG